jgi:hypothetical protein
MDITDNLYAIKDIDPLLRFTDNMPLAVDLIAHLVDYEGLANVLTRLETGKTSLLSVGCERQSNLDLSISLSLSSPRLTMGSRELLSLLSILPDGLSDSELVQSNLPIPDILSCKATLLATALAYQDNMKRLRSLMPIREHVQQISLLSQSLIQCLCKHFHFLLDLFQKYRREQLRPVVYSVILELIESLGISARFYCAAGFHFNFYQLDQHQARQFYERALELYRSCDNSNGQCAVLCSIAELKWQIGDYRGAQVHAQEARRLSKLSANLYD